MGTRLLNIAAIRGTLTVTESVETVHDMKRSDSEKKEADASAGRFRESNRKCRDCTRYDSALTPSERKPMQWRDDSGSTGG
eukprot:1330427-Pyramimonas_sp.AAC.1